MVHPTSSTATFTLVRTALHAYSCGVCTADCSEQCHQLRGWGVIYLLYLLACALPYRYLMLITCQAFQYRYQLDMPSLSVPIQSECIYVTCHDGHGIALAHTSSKSGLAVSLACARPRFNLGFQHNTYKAESTLSPSLLGKTHITQMLTKVATKSRRLPALARLVMTHDEGGQRRGSVDPAAGECIWSISSPTHGHSTAGMPNTSSLSILKGVEHQRL
jgi:hypothetical protein